MRSFLDFGSDQKKERYSHKSFGIRREHTLLKWERKREKERRTNYKCYY
jgi:hypothetical protein